MRQIFLASAAMALAISAPSIAQTATPAPAAASTEDARLTAFLDAEYADLVKMNPQLATRLGLKDGKDKFSDNSDAGALKQLEWRRASVAKMKAQFDRAKLSGAMQANYDIWAGELDRAEMSYQFRRWQPPFYSFLYSMHSQLADFMINSHTVQDAADMHAYAARLRLMPGVLDVAIDQSRQSDAMGIRAPKFEIERVIAGSKTLISGAPFDGGADSPLWADAKTKTAKLVKDGKVTQAEGDALLEETKAALLSIKPGYERVIAWATAELPTAPSGAVGASSLPQGKAWYAAALKQNTTTDLTAAQIHQIGLDEIKRIEGEQDKLARSAGFKDREAYYADRKKKFPPTPWTDELRKQYLDTANAAVAHNRTLLAPFFGELPKYRAEVNREPSFSEVAGGAAHASGPSPDGTRPGRVFVHLLGTMEDPAAVYDLMCHEGVPGHVMQGDIAARQSVGPKFRKTTGFVAYQEGWGVYSEALCKEMGAYPDVAADFMRYDQELFRATRLVVDTGIHDLGWTEDQAVEYMEKTGRQAPDHARSEVRRYITLPGQATGYKIGMLKIMELRHKAEKELGPKFDIRGFHDLVIGSGSMPLGVLETQVNAWIAAKKG